MFMKDVIFDYVLMRTVAKYVVLSVPKLIYVHTKVLQQAEMQASPHAQDENIINFLRHY